MQEKYQNERVVTGDNEMMMMMIMMMIIIIIIIIIIANGDLTCQCQHTVLE